MIRSQVAVRRVYDAPAATDGQRVLVDRLWPRGLTKERAHLDAWVKAVAPSTALRQWYAHDPDKYQEFAERYRRELQDAERADALRELRFLAAQGPLTLLTASKRVDISEAVVLQKALTETDAAGAAASG